MSCSALLQACCFPESITFIPSLKSQHCVYAIHDLDSIITRPTQSKLSFPRTVTIEQQFPTCESSAPSQCSNIRHIEYHIFALQFLTVATFQL